MNSNHESNPNPEAPRLLPASRGSAEEAVNRRQVWMQCDDIKRWAAIIERALNEDPSGVIPWLHLQGLSEALSKLTYCAGHVNAIVLARGRISDPPNNSSH